MNKRISLTTYLLFALIYANQGMFGLNGASIYYLQRETWKLSVFQMSVIGMIVTIPWVIKPLWGILIDCYPLFKKRTKYWLILNYSIISLISIYISIFGLNYWLLILTGFLFGLCFAINDVASDGFVCVLEKKFNLSGRLQSVSWFALSFAGLITSLGGAWIAKYHGYKLAYLLCSIFPMIMIYFIYKYHNEGDVIGRRLDKKELKEIISIFTKKDLIIPMLFLFCYFVSPSFGTPLMVKMREVLHMDKMMIGFLGSVGTIFGLLGYLFYFFKGYKYNIKNLLYFTVGFGCFSTLWYLWIPDQWWLLAYNIILGSVGAVSHLVILAYVAKITPKGHECLVFAGLCSVLNLGSMGSGFIGGLLYDVVGFNWLVIISSFLTFLCLFFISHLNLDKV